MRRHHRKMSVYLWLTDDDSISRVAIIRVNIMQWTGYRNEVVQLSGSRFAWSVIGLLILLSLSKLFSQPDLAVEANFVSTPASTVNVSCLPDANVEGEFSKMSTMCALSE